LAAARKIFDPEIKSFWIERASLLTRTAVEYVRFLTIHDELKEFKRLSATHDELTELANPKGLDEFRRRLANLPPGMNARLPNEDYIKLFAVSGDPFNAARATSEECGCSVDVRPDSTIWFTKRSRTPPQSN
jgi:hypothetical protein